MVNSICIEESSCEVSAPGRGPASRRRPVGETVEQRGVGRSPKGHVGGGCELRARECSPDGTKVVDARHRLAAVSVH
jgi:hypothetical protein